jgi:hypothetical protein
MSRGGVAYRPYTVIMIGALPPFVGDIVHGTSHHVLTNAVKAADRWCDVIAALGTIPEWPFSFGVIDARDGSYPHMTDTEERKHYGNTAYERRGSRKAGRR